MKRRILEALSVSIVMGFVLLLQTTAQGQAPAAAADQKAAPAEAKAAAGPAGKTPWGAPDIQGIRYDEFATPFERPARYADKEVLTDEERGKEDSQRAEDSGRNERAERGSVKDVAGAYNAVFTTVLRTGRRTSLIAEPANGKLPPLTPETQERNKIDKEFRLALLQNTGTCKTQAGGCAGGKYGPPSPKFAEPAPFYNTGRMNRHNGPEDQSLGDRCMLGATPDFNGFHRIVQGPKVIALGVDTGQGQGYQRVIYMDGNHPPASIHLRHGDSRGHFEGNTLVVETTNFSPKFPFRGSDPNMKLVERFTRVDAKSMEYTATITDPTVWSAPWTAKQDLSLQPDKENRIYYEPRCHEGNYGLPALLVGARLDEKRFREGKGPNPVTQDTANCVNDLSEQQ